VFLSISKTCGGAFAGGGSGKSGSSDADAVSLLSSPLIVSGGDGGSCVALDVA
jgi:hypothetical protein